MSTVPKTKPTGIVQVIVKAHTTTTDEAVTVPNLTVGRVPSASTRKFVPVMVAVAPPGSREEEGDMDRTVGAVVNPAIAFRRYGLNLNSEMGFDMSAVYVKFCAYTAY